MANMVGQNMPVNTCQRMLTHVNTLNVISWAWTKVRVLDSLAKSECVPQAVLANHEQMLDWQVGRSAGRIT